MLPMTPSDDQSRREVVPVLPSRISQHAQFIGQATAHLPYTQEGLPIGYYRADLANPASIYLQPDDENPELSKQMEERSLLQGAFIELSYEHGFPTQPNGEPFWQRLEAEDGIAFGCFQKYNESVQLGPRDLSTLASDHEIIKVLTANAARTEPLPREDVLARLQEWFYMYCWQNRSKAYDIFKEAAFRHKRLQRAMTAQDYHFDVAEKILQQLDAFFKGPDWIQELDPGTALTMLAKLVQIQRVSVGLPAAGPLPTKDQDPNTSFEMIMRNVVQKATAESDSIGRGKDITAEATSKAVEEVMKDANTIRSLQEVIVRVTQQTQQPAEHRGPKGRGRTYDNLGNLEKDDEASATGSH
jgi:hypothetical protein